MDTIFQFIRKGAGFIKARFAAQRLSGLTAALLLLALAFVFFLLTGAIEGVVNSEAVISVDYRFANLIAGWRNAVLVKFFLWVTMLGEWELVLGFGAAVVALLWFGKNRGHIVSIVFAAAGSEIFTLAGKLLLERPRPETAVYLENGFSFPSGHAAIAIAFYGYLAYALIRQTKNRRARASLFFPAAVLILLIGFSRLYLGVHYLSDVLGGYLVGGAWLLIAIGIAEFKNNK